MKLIVVVAVLGMVSVACQASTGEATTTNGQTSTTVATTTSTAPAAASTSSTVPTTTSLPSREHVSDLGRLAYEAIGSIPDAHFHGEELAEDAGTLAFFGLGGHAYQAWLNAGQDDPHEGLGDPIDEAEVGDVRVWVYEVADDEDYNFVAVCELLGVGLGVRVSSHTATVDELIETSAVFTESLLAVTDTGE